MCDNCKLARFILACVAGPQFYGGPDLQRAGFWRARGKNRRLVLFETSFIENMLQYGGYGEYACLYNRRRLGLVLCTGS